MRVFSFDQYIFCMKFPTVSKLHIEMQIYTASLGFHVIARLFVIF